MPRFQPADLSQVPLDDLVEHLQDELETDLRRTLSGHRDQQLYVLALCLGEHATSVYVTANTEEHIRLIAADDADLDDRYWRWDCSGDWAVIEPETLVQTNRFLSDLRKAHDAWLWSFDREERADRSAQTWSVLESRLVEVFHEALRQATAGEITGKAARDQCIVCLLALDDPDFTRWSALQLNDAAAVERELGTVSDN